MKPMKTNKNITSINIRGLLPLFIFRDIRCIQLEALVSGYSQEAVYPKVLLELNAYENGSHKRPLKG